jgi:hypothetical protein
MHLGLAAEITKDRQTVLTRAYKAHPERFVRSAPVPPLPPTAAWINRPENGRTTDNEAVIVASPSVEVPHGQLLQHPSETIGIGGPITH